MGGFPTFCEDPDELLQLPEVRDALEAAGMTLHYWDGTPDSLGIWANVPSADKPLVIVEPDYPKHLIESTLKNHLLESISLGEIFSKFHSTVIKELPKEHWDELFVLHQTERPHRTPEETAILIGRAFYGADPLYLTFGGGWTGLLTDVAESGRVLPVVVANALLEIVKTPPYLSKDEGFEVLTDPVVARSRVKELLGSNQGFAESASPSIKSGLMMTAESPAKGYGKRKPIDWLGKWNASSDSPLDVLKFALEYGLGASQDDVSSADRLSLSCAFFAWLRQNYSYAMTSSSPDILKLHTLVKHLHEQSANQPLLFVVVDALGVESWYAIEDIWRERIGFNEATVRGAFAILPTMTTLSRRAIFEGKMPSQFGSGDDSQDLERRTWRQRFGDDGGYFTPADTVKLDHAFARQTKRVAVVDTSWDSMGHSIYPQADSVVSAAKRWGKASPLAEILKSGLDHGYRVVITADHGQIACIGAGRPNLGSLTEQRNKRAIVFDNEALLQSYASYGIADFHPYGMPEDGRVLFAKDLDSFDLHGVQGVSHGGATIEEVIVPVIEVAR
jgi:hypothetical protein